jgi:hypothetical protein
MRSSIKAGNRSLPFRNQHTGDSGTVAGHKHAGGEIR